MALTFPFRGPIPDWLDPETAGHRYWRPAEIPVKLAGRDLLDGASAVYAFAPEHLRQGLKIAHEELRQLGIPPTHDRKQTLEWVGYLHREDHEADLERTPEFQNWLAWVRILNDIWLSFIPLLLDGRLTAFGDPDRPGSYPHWIHPRTWLALEADTGLGMEGRFSGHGLVFWNVRVVRTVEVMADAVTRDNPAKELHEVAARPHPTSAECVAWFVGRVRRHSDAPRHPTEKADLEAAEEHFGCKVQREVIRSLRVEYVPAHRRRQCPTTS